MSKINPRHYRIGTMEPRHVAKDWGLEYYCASVLKYICRHEHKGNPVQDLQKAKQFLDFRIEELLEEERRKRAPHPQQLPAYAPEPVSPEEWDTEKTEPRGVYEIQLEQEIREAKWDKPIEVVRCGECRRLSCACVRY